MRTVLDFCTGGGGEFLGLEAARFAAVATIDNDRAACQTMRRNRPELTVIEDDLRNVNGSDFRGIDLLAGGVPCPPFSVAGKQLGESDERDLFPEALRLVEEGRPRAVMFENVSGFALPRFATYRANLLSRLQALGYEVEWRVLHASSFGLPQLRPRFILVAMRPRAWARFRWPSGTKAPLTVGVVLGDLMGERGWPGASAWSTRADAIAPTLVGGSKKHGGPDLGPTRAKRQWGSLGVDGGGIANDAPGPDFPLDGRPKLTVRMAARLQGFPDSWQFEGGKTAAYRQVGNALPPPVAEAVGRAIRDALDGQQGATSVGRPQRVYQVALPLDSEAVNR